MSTNDDSGWGRSARGGDGTPEPSPAPAPDAPTQPQRPPVQVPPPAPEPQQPQQPRHERPPQQRPPEGPPDLDEFWQDLSNRFNGMFGGKGGGRGGMGAGRGPSGPKGPSFSGRGLVMGAGAAIVIGGALWLATGFYTVQEGQVAVVQRFGKFSRISTEAGIQWNLPYPFETHQIVDRSRLRQTEVGYRNSVRNKVTKESLILTKDQSIVDMQFAVQYRISSPEDFLYQNNLSTGGEELIRQVAESAMREVVGRRGTDEVLYEDKAQVAEDAQTMTQGILDRYRLGIQVVDLTIQQVQPPEQVQAAFEDANKADQDRQRLINEGQAYANDVIPRARGTADRLVLEAQAYRARVVAQAQGDALRFDQILTQYANAPEVTRERMYLETMQQIFSNTSKVYLDSRQGNGNMLYLPLDKLLEKAGAKPRVGSTPTPGSQRSDAAVEQAPVSTRTPQPASTGNQFDGRAAAADALRSRERSYSRP
ncbi:MAG: FtsH protease activity modulator HflK [Lautropia sp.]|nr:FtsH protease activity modulator HflK [Lautropia sp.]